MIYQLIMNTLIGAGTGYITNNIAIKMLFKKYFGRFGGMIEDTHDEFVENISKLIEKDLINHSTLANEFQSEKFRDYIKELVKDMFIHSLVNNSVALQDIEGVHATKDNLLEFLDTNTHHRKKIKKELASQPFSNLLSRSQVSHFSHHIANVLDKNKDLYIKELTNSLKSFKLQDFIHDELLEIVSQNLKDIIYKIDFQKYDIPIDKSLKNLLSTIKIDEILQLAQTEIQNIYLHQLFMDTKEGTKELIKIFLEIATSKDGKIAIYESVEVILDNIKGIDSSILDLLNDNIKESLKLFIKRELPNIIKQVITFMDQNEKDLEDLINNSIDDALSGGAFGSIKKKIVSILYTNIVADFKVLNMLKEFINQNKNRAEDEIIAQALDILENKSIGKIYTFISEKKILTAQKITDLIIQNLDTFDLEKNFHLVDVALNKQVKEYTEVNMDLVKEKLIPYSVKTIKKKYLYTDKFKEQIHKEITNLIEEFKVQTLEEIFAEKLDKITKIVSQKIDKEILFETISTNANKLLANPMNEVLDIDEININYQEHLDIAIASRSIKELITQMQSEEIYIAVESALIKVIVDNLEEILEGNVSEAVKTELSKLPPSQIKDMVEEFMGEELKPINYFGAVLGGTAGAVVGTLSIPVFINPFLYGVVGVATNYLAIKMLFQPYKPLKIGKFKVPFSEGVLPSNKSKMAIKMSEFVDEFMLNGTSIQDFFNKNSENLKSFIKEHIAQDNFSIIDKLIHQNSNTHDVSNEVVTLIFNYLDKNSELVSKKIYDIALSYYDKREDFEQIGSELIFREVMQRDFSEFLYEQFTLHVDQDLSLAFISQDLLEEVDKFISQYFDIFTQMLLDSSKLKEYLNTFEVIFQNFITQNSLNNILDNSIKEKVNNSVNSSLVDLLYGHGTINELLNFFTNGEFGEESKLSDMINGMLPDIIERNLNRIINGGILPALRENKKIIRKEIMRKVPFGAGWAVKRDVDRTINIILDEQVPDFIQAKTQEINLIVQEVLKTKIVDIGYTKDVINQKKVDSLIISILSSENFNQSIQKSMTIFIEQIFDMKLAKILKIFGITNLSQLYDLFELNTGKIIHLLYRNIIENKSDILHIIKNLTNEQILRELLEELKIKDLLKSVNREVLLKEFSYLEKNLKKSPLFQKSMQNILNKFINTFIKREFLDKNIFKKDLERFFLEILDDKEKLRHVLVPFLKEFIININKILDLKLKNHMLDIIIESAFESIDRTIVSLISSVDFKKVITKEIEEMHPKELRDMFYSFAGPYFNKLILYGSLGFIFGLITLFEV